MIVLAGNWTKQSPSAGRGWGWTCPGQEHLQVWRRPTNEFKYVEGGVSDAQYECGFEALPHVSRTRDVGMEDRMAEVDLKFNALKNKFNVMQSSIELVMAKLGITVSRMASTPSDVE